MDKHCHKSICIENVLRLTSCSLVGVCMCAPGLLPDPKCSNGTFLCNWFLPPFLWSCLMELTTWQFIILLELTSKKWYGTVRYSWYYLLKGAGLDYSPASWIRFRIEWNWIELKGTIFFFSSISDANKNGLFIEAGRCGDSGGGGGRCAQLDAPTLRSIQIHTLIHSFDQISTPLCHSAKHASNLIIMQSKQFMYVF